MVEVCRALKPHRLSNSQPSVLVTAFFAVAVLGTLDWSLNAILASWSAIQKYAVTASVKTDALTQFLNLLFLV